MAVRHSFCLVNVFTNGFRLTDTPYFTKYPEAAAVIRHGVTLTLDACKCTNAIIS